MAIVIVFLILHGFGEVSANLGEGMNERDLTRSH